MWRCKALFSETDHNSHSHLLALLVTSPVRSAMFPKGLFSAFCKLFSWLPAFCTTGNPIWLYWPQCWHSSQTTLEFWTTTITWKPLRATKSRRMSLVPSKIRKILRSLKTLSTPASCTGRMLVTPTSHHMTYHQWTTGKHKPWVKVCWLMHIYFSRGWQPYVADKSLNNTHRYYSGMDSGQHEIQYYCNTQHLPWKCILLKCTWNACWSQHF